MKKPLKSFVDWKEKTSYLINNEEDCWRSLEFRFFLSKQKTFSYAIFTRQWVVNKAEIYTSFIPNTTTSFCWYSALLIMPASWTEYYFFMETHFKEKHIRYIFVRNFIHISQKYKKEQQVREWNRVGKKWDNIMPCMSREHQLLALRCVRQWTVFTWALRLWFCLKSKPFLNRRLLLAFSSLRNHGITGTFSTYNFFAKRLIVLSKSGMTTFANQ